MHGGRFILARLCRQVLVWLRAGGVFARLRLRAGGRDDRGRPTTGAVTIACPWEGRLQSKTRTEHQQQQEQQGAVTMKNPHRATRTEFPPHVYYVSGGRGRFRHRRFARMLCIGMVVWRR